MELNLLQYWKKPIRQAIFFIACFLATIAMAFDNEPKGFRGLDWGVTLAEYINSASIVNQSRNPQGSFKRLWDLPFVDLSNTMQWRKADAKSINGILKIDANAFNLNQLEAYTRSDDKTVIGRVNTGQSVYYFYKSRFIASSTFYSVDAQPGGKTSRNDMPMELQRQFGTPTETTGIWADFFAQKNLITAYKGETTTIIDECTNPKGAYMHQCVLLFFSTRDWNNYIKDSQFMLDELQDQKNAARKAADIAESARKAAEDAKPSF